MFISLTKDFYDQERLEKAKLLEEDIDRNVYSVQFGNGVMVLDPINCQWFDSQLEILSPQS